MSSPVKVISVVVALLVLIGFGVWLGIDLSSSSHRSTAPTPTPTTSRPVGGVSPPAGSFDVVSYGADPTGVRDSTTAIRAAFAAAQKASTTTNIPTVYFPSGTYTLNDPDKANVDFAIGRSVNVLGAGEQTTKIVEEVGTNKYPASQLYGGQEHGKTVFNFNTQTNGFYFNGLTVDSQTYNGGDTLDNFGNNSTIENSAFLGGYSGTGQTNDTAQDDFDLRDVHVCSYNATTNTFTGYAVGNVITNVTLSGQGVGGNDDIGLTCQQNITVSNITDTGWGMALYVVDNANITNFQYTPWNLATRNTGAMLSQYPTNPLSPTLTPQVGCKTFGCNWGFFITSGLNVNITNFTTSGGGGNIVGQGSNGLTAVKANRPSQNIKIVNEKMTNPAYTMEITDANNITLEDSTIQKVQLNNKTTPINGITVQNSTLVLGLHCASPTLVTGLVGVSCKNT